MELKDKLPTMTEVPVEKKWVGKAVNEIEVKLLANGKEVQTAKLNEGMGKESR